MTQNSLILGLGFAIGKIVISMLAAYAIVYFRFPLANFFFWMIFITLLLPLEVRILPSYEVVQGMGLLNTYTGLILPLIASATGTFFFRQFFRSIPDELVEAARIDGAGPFKFFWDILVPLSKTMIAAIFIIMFVVGWNQYLWPVMMTTEEHLYTMVRGIRQVMQTYIGANIPEYNIALAMAVLAMHARSATMSQIPTSTGAAAAVGLVLPELNGKLDGFSMRVPTINVSVVDLSFIAKRDTTVEEVNAVLKSASEGSLKGILGYSDQPLVSVDFNHNPNSSTFDATLTKVMNGNLVKVLSWYDNEWGFSNRMLDTALALVAAQ